MRTVISPFNLMICLFLWSAVTIASDETESSGDNTKTSENVFLRDEGIVDSPGKLTAEMGVYMQRLTGARGSDLVKRHAFFSPFVFRYGVGADAEVSLTLPISYVRDDTSNNNVALSKSDSLGIGDVALEFKKRVASGVNGGPDIYLNLRYKDATADHSENGQPALGSGFRQYSISSLFSTSIDPAIYFGQIAYEYVESNTINGVKFKPGQIVRYRFGAGYVLSSRVVLGIQLIGEATEKGSSDNGSILPQHQVSLQLSNTIIKNRNSFFEPTISIGLTPESPDFMIGIAFPLF